MQLLCASCLSVSVRTAAVTVHAGFALCEPHLSALWQVPGLPFHAPSPLMQTPAAQAPLSEPQSEAREHPAQYVKDTEIPSPPIDDTPPPPPSSSSAHVRCYCQSERRVGHWPLHAGSTLEHCYACQQEFLPSLNLCSTQVDTDY